MGAAVANIYAVRASNIALLGEMVATRQNEPETGFDSIPDAIRALSNGEFVVVLDDEDRENEGDLIIAADKVTPERIAFMVEETSGVICVGLPAETCRRLDLPLMVPSAENEESMYTAFTVTVDLREGITTGISASDRSKTIRALGDPSTSAAELRKPGHIFPLMSREGGVLVRPGHTEAAVDLARLAGSSPAGVLCEVVDRRTGEMARTAQLQALARRFGLRCITIDALVAHRLEHEQLVRVVSTRGDDVARTACFECAVDGCRSRAVANVAGDVASSGTRPFISFDVAGLPAAARWEGEEPEANLQNLLEAGPPSIRITTLPVPHGDDAGEARAWTPANTVMLHGVLQHLACRREVCTSCPDVAAALAKLDYDVLLDR